MRDPGTIQEEVRTAIENGLHSIVNVIDGGNNDSSLEVVRRACAASPTPIYSHRGSDVFSAAAWKTRDEARRGFEDLLIGSPCPECNSKAEFEKDVSDLLSEGSLTPDIIKELLRSKSELWDLVEKMRAWATAIVTRRTMEEHWQATANGPDTARALAALGECEEAILSHLGTVVTDLGTDVSRRTGGFFPHPTAQVLILDHIERSPLVVKPGGAFNDRIWVKHHGHMVWDDANHFGERSPRRKILVLLSTSPLPPTVSQAGDIRLVDLR